MNPEFPIGDTLRDGAYAIVEHLAGYGAQRLYQAARSSGLEDRYLASMILAWEGLPEDDVWRNLGYRIPGVFDLEHVGHFDVRGEDERRRIAQEQHWVLLERIPEGDWLPRLLTTSLGPRGAVKLGLSVGRILQQAAGCGVPLVGIRPEYVWARHDGEQLLATGLTGRNHVYFAHTGRGCVGTGNLFERSYLAPETLRSRLQVGESIVFSLAMMIAEWAGGAYPFPDSWVGDISLSYYEGRHAPLMVPPALDELLDLGLHADPGHRPSLNNFLEQMGGLTDEQLSQ